MIPPLLLMWYNFIGRGGTLRALCTICFYISSVCGILAVVLLWLVYPKEARLALPPWLIPVCWRILIRCRCAVACRSHGIILDSPWVL